MINLRFADVLLIVLVSLLIYGILYLVNRANKPKTDITSASEPEMSVEDVADGNDKVDS